MLGISRVRIARVDGRLEALEVRLDRAGEVAILGPLPNGAGVALAL